MKVKKKMIRWGLPFWLLALFLSGGASVQAETANGECGDFWCYGAWFMLESTGEAPSPGNSSYYLFELPSDDVCLDGSGAELWDGDTGYPEDCKIKGKFISKEQSLGSYYTNLGTYRLLPLSGGTASLLACLGCYGLFVYFRRKRQIA